MTRSLFTTLAALLTLGNAMAAPLKTDPAQSTITITFKQMNVPVDAKFRKFVATIDYDKDKPAQGKATIDLDIASFDLGDAEYNHEVLKMEWFNAAQFPKAAFIADSMKPLAPGKLEVTGKLTIKGKTMPVSFPVIVKNENRRWIFDGSLPIRRLPFNIGEGDWKDTSMVADEITIKFHLTTQQE